MMKVGNFLLVLLVIALPPLEAKNVRSRTKAEILKISDQFFGKRYEPIPGKPLAYDEREETGSPDAVFYPHGSSHLVEIIFSSKGEFVRMELIREDLLYQDDGNGIRKDVELPSSEHQWIAEMANKLRPIGRHPGGSKRTSGPDLLGSTSSSDETGLDFYELARVQSGWFDGKMRSVEISYQKLIAGKINETRVIEKGYLDMQIDSVWYRIFVDSNNSAPKRGDFVHLVTMGCTGKEKACFAGIAAPSKR